MNMSGLGRGRTYRGFADFVDSTGSAVFDLVDAIAYSIQVIVELRLDTIHDRGVNNCPIFR
jgi:hypothetical protein